MNAVFRAFCEAYPPEKPIKKKPPVAQLAHCIRESFGIETPATLRSFWSQVGFGYFGNRELLFFGPGNGTPTKRTLLSWNSMPFWGPLFHHLDLSSQIIFFGETCFGEQIGFAINDNHCSAVLLEPDMLDLYIITDNFADFFPVIMEEPHSLVDHELLTRLTDKLGPVPDNMHYAPIVSPLVGGSDQTENFHFESPEVHFLTSLATLQSRFEQD